MCLKIILFADGDDLIGGESFCLLVVADDERTLLLPFGKEAQTCFVRAADEGQGLVGRIVAVF